MPFEAALSRADQNGNATAANLGTILRIPITVQVVLGSATMPVSGLMSLGRGAIVPLNRRVGEPVEVMVNGRVVARGELVVLEEDDSRFGIALTEIVGSSGPG
ncbi:MAG TPA: flagellar motor switch protein FliN [Propylenella sp.]|nr:flagellar motor switch protein FliN [Propylenella sp.]